MTNEDLKKLPQPLCSRLLFSVKEVCKIANISRAGLYVDLKHGVCKGVKLGGKTRIERAELINYINCKPFEATGYHASADDRLAEAVSAMESA